MSATRTRRDRLRRARVSDQSGRSVVLPRLLPLRARFPATPGAECVGRVRAVGAGVSDLKPGDLVINMQRENWAQARRVRAADAIPIPAGSRPAAGRDAAHQPADRAAAARRPCRAAARRLCDPECREFGGRPARHRARQGARRAHDQCRAARRCGRGICARSAPTRLSRTAPICRAGARGGRRRADPARHRRDFGRGHAAHRRLRLRWRCCRQLWLAVGRGPGRRPRGADPARRDADRLYIWAAASPSAARSRCARSMPISAPNCATASCSAPIDFDLSDRARSRTALTHAQRAGRHGKILVLPNGRVG